MIKPRQKIKSRIHPKGLPHGYVKINEFIVRTEYYRGTEYETQCCIHYFQQAGEPPTKCPEGCDEAALKVPYVSEMRSS